LNSIEKLVELFLYPACSVLRCSLVANVFRHFVYPLPLAPAHIGQIVEFALNNKLPGLTFWEGYAEQGFLMFYGPRLSDQYRRAAGYVDKILKGAEPASLPVEQPTKFELVVNLKTAKALGLAVPATLLAQADEVIE